MPENKHWLIFVAPLMWLLGWLLVVLFSHDIVSLKLNHKNLEKQQQIQQLEFHHSWNFSVISEVVGSFRGKWQLVDGGLETTADNPEISLELAGRRIYPQIQQQISWEIHTETAKLVGAKVLLEFSDQYRNDFYYSPEIPLQDVLQGIDLTQIKWHRQVGQSKGLNWEQLPTMNALVVRFYFPQKTVLKLKKIILKQTKHLNQQQPEWGNCNEGILCFITNQQNAMNQDNSQQPLPTTVFIVIADFSIWIWLVAAFSVTVLGVWLVNKCIEMKVWLLVAGVFGFIGLMAQPWMMSFGSQLKWPVLMVFFLAVWWYRECLLQFDRPVVWLWLGSIVVALLMLLQSGWELGYLVQFPGYFIWALLQQLLIGPVVSDILYQQLHKHRLASAVLTGVLFSVIHAPNHTLMMATLLAGVVWSYCWLKYRNLYVNAFSHALLALTFYQVMPEAWLGSARIGVFF